VCDEKRLAQAGKELNAAVLCAVAVMVAMGYNERLAGNKLFATEVTSRVWSLAMDPPEEPSGMLSH
jgi:hypothetical protein